APCQARKQEDRPLRAWHGAEIVNQSESPRPVPGTPPTPQLETPNSKLETKLPPTTVPPHPEPIGRQRAGRRTRRGRGRLGRECGPGRGRRNPEPGGPGSCESPPDRGGSRSVRRCGGPLPRGCAPGSNLPKVPNLRKVVAVTGPGRGPGGPEPAGWLVHGQPG